jgi:hypothetical protein
MINKTVIGLHLVLAIALSIHLFFLWQGLHFKPILEEEKNAAASSIAASLFKPSVRTSYPSLFNVQIPEPLHKKEAKNNNQQTTVTDEKIVKEILETPEGMRLRAIFTSQDQRIALVESPKKGNTPFLEVRETDVVKGYQVQTVAARYITLLREKDQESFKLVIFDLNQNKPNKAK